MQSTKTNVIEWDREKLNRDIAMFEQVHPITEDMTNEREGISRMVMLDRYSFKDTEKLTLGEGDLVILTVKEDPNYPQRGIGVVQYIEDEFAYILVEEEYRANIEDLEEKESGIVKRHVDTIDKPMEIYYEQHAKRVSTGLSQYDKPDKQQERQVEYEELISSEDFVPAGRILYGAGSGADVTLFNCFVLPFPQDSREGISQHRQDAMSIMSRGGKL